MVSISRSVTLALGWAMTHEGWGEEEGDWVIRQSNYLLLYYEKFSFLCSLSQASKQMFLSLTHWTLCFNIMFYLNHVSIVSVYRYFRFWQLPVLVSYHSLPSLFYYSLHTDPFWRPCLLRYSLEVCLQTISCPGEDKWIGAVWGQHCGSPFYCAFSVQASAFTRGALLRTGLLQPLADEPLAHPSRVWNGVVGSCLHAATFWGISSAVGMRGMSLPCGFLASFTSES